MSNRTKIILLIALTIILIGLLLRSVLILRTATAPSPSKKIATTKTPATPTTPTPQASTVPVQPTPATITNLSLELPPRNPFQPLVRESKATPSGQKTTPLSPPKLPAPIVTQLPSGQASTQPSTANLVLLGTVLGPQKLAIIKIGEKSFIVREGEKIDGLKIYKVERGRVLFEGGEVTLNTKEGGRSE
ncbi:hypothetical protein H5T87_01145 [bacterium]|nr:hypothetical protein [bacterium]